MKQLCRHKAICDLHFTGMASYVNFSERVSNLCLKMINKKTVVVVVVVSCGYIFPRKPIVY